MLNILFRFKYNKRILTRVSFYIKIYRHSNLIPYIYLFAINMFFSTILFILIQPCLVKSKSSQESLLQRRKFTPTLRMELFYFSSVYLFRLFIYMFFK